MFSILLFQVNQQVFTTALKMCNKLAFNKKLTIEFMALIENKTFLIESKL